MPRYRTIEIDVDVHRRIEDARTDFDETPNDILRRLLGLGTEPETRSKARNGQRRSWHGKGVTLPHGTHFRMEYSGRMYEGTIDDGLWAIDGESFTSPSGAASGAARTAAGTPTRLNGWIYWTVKRPGDETWIPLNSLRERV